MQTRPEDEIRARAYQIWEDEGRPEGRAEENWRQASEELDAAAHNRFTGGPDDLGRDPRIGTSGGLAGSSQGELAGDSTLEGDVMSDSTPVGGVEPRRRGRTNA